MPVMNQKDIVVRKNPSTTPQVEKAAQSRMEDRNAAIRAKKAEEAKMAAARMPASKQSTEPVKTTSSKASEEAAKKAESDRKFQEIQKQLEQNRIDAEKRQVESQSYKRPRPQETPEAAQKRIDLGKKQVEERVKTQKENEQRAYQEKLKTIGGMPGKIPVNYGKINPTMLDDGKVVDYDTWVQRTSKSNYSPDEPGYSWAESKQGKTQYESLARDTKRQLDEMVASPEYKSTQQKNAALSKAGDFYRQAERRYDTRPNQSQAQRYAATDIPLARQKTFKSGGSVKASRGDGCAQRGKTKGRYI